MQPVPTNLSTTEVENLLELLNRRNVVIQRSNYPEQNFVILYKVNADYATNRINLSAFSNSFEIEMDIDTNKVSFMFADEQASQVFEFNNIFDALLYVYQVIAILSNNSSQNAMFAIIAFPVIFMMLFKLYEEIAKDKPGDLVILTLENLLTHCQNIAFDYDFTLSSVQKDYQTQ